MEEVVITDVFCLWVYLAGIKRKSSVCFKIGSAFAGNGNSNGNWNNWGTNGNWWSASVPYQNFNANNTGNLNGPNQGNANHWFSVRCVKKYTFRYTQYFNF